MMRTVLQVVRATTSMYSCSSDISWNPIAYIPVVNNADMVDSARSVASQLNAVKTFDLLDRPTFMAEDIAFFNGQLPAHLVTSVVHVLQLRLLQMQNNSIAAILLLNC